MVVGKLVTKLIQSLPTWEVTKYYGRVCLFQLKCLKYRVQTSEAWFNFKCKFMPGSLRNEAECEEVRVKEELPKERKPQEKKLSSETLTNTQMKRMKYVKDKRNKESSRSTESIDDSCTDNNYTTKGQKYSMEENEKYQQNQKYRGRDTERKRQRKAKQYQR